MLARGRVGISDLRPVFSIKEVLPEDRREIEAYEAANPGIAEAIKDKFSDQGEYDAVIMSAVVNASQQQQSRRPPGRDARKGVTHKVELARGQGQAQWKPQ